MKDSKGRNYYPFNYKGLVAVSDNSAVIIVKELGHACGYTEFNSSEIPKEWHSNYSADGLQYLSVHGGITFCETVKADRFHRGKVIFGFDCGHAGDEEDLLLQDVEYVMKLTTQMRQQLQQYARAIFKWRRLKRRGRIHLMEKIRDTADVKLKIGFGGLIDTMAGGKTFGSFKGGNNE